MQPQEPHLHPGCQHCPTQQSTAGGLHGSWEPCSGEGCAATCWAENSTPSPDAWSASAPLHSAYSVLEWLPASLEHRKSTLLGSKWPFPPGLGSEKSTEPRCAPAPGDKGPHTRPTSAPSPAAHLPARPHGPALSRFSSQPGLEVCDR